MYQDLDVDDDLESVATIKVCFKCFVSPMQIAMDTASFHDVHGFLNDAIFKTATTTEVGGCKKASRVFRDKTPAHYFKSICQ